VAFRAFALARACFKLAFVRIGRVADGALFKGKRLFEIACRVAFGASHFFVHSDQRIFCFGMVELHRRIHFFPGGRRMAGFARSLKRTFVRIGVAIDASAELDTSKLHGLVGARGDVALLAGDLDVHSGQRVLGLGVVELLGLLPVGYIVAAHAVGPELPSMDVFVARRAILRKPQKRTGKIFLSNQLALRRDHMCRRVALFARYRFVFFDERVAGLAMIELLERRLPVDQREILAVMLEVATDAIPAVGIFHTELGVVPLARRQTVRNFLMAIEALERRRAGSELVATIALR